MPNFQQFSSPIGEILSAATEQGICLLEFADEKSDKAIMMKKLEQQFKSAVTDAPNHQLDQLQHQLQEYFNGSRREFSIALDLQGTEFQKQVWQELLMISYGETRTYLQQARALKNEKAIRAVAGANGKNKIAILVPCHRVIGKDGKLTGYAGGLWRKQFLLELERKTINNGIKTGLFE